MMIKKTAGKVKQGSEAYLNKHKREKPGKA
jgi:hypothetical protein